MSRLHTLPGGNNKALQELNDRLSRVEAQSLPVGVLFLWSGSEPPEGWLKCDGTPVNRRSYPELWNVMQNRAGATSGVFVEEGNFMLPNVTVSTSGQSFYYIVKAR